MDKVQRWTGHVTAFEGGGFVAYGDYLELHAENERLKAELDKAEIKIDRLEWENKGIAEWRDEYTRVKGMYNALKAELGQWRNNHKNVVDRLRLATQRKDLPVDRIPAIKRMEELQAELATLRQSQQAVRLAVQHAPYCMRLDPYDERDWGCTCGAELATAPQPSQPNEDGIIVHDAVPHPDMTFDEEEKPQ